MIITARESPHRRWVNRLVASQRILIAMRMLFRASQLTVPVLQKVEVYGEAVLTVVFDLSVWANPVVISQV